MKQFYIVFILILCASSSFAQDQDIERSAVSLDTTVIIKAQEEGKALFRKDVEAAKKVFEKTLDQSILLDYNKGATNATNYLAKIYRSQGNSEKSLEYYSESAEYALKFGDTGKIGIAHFNYGLALGRSKKYNEAIRALEEAYNSFSLLEKKGFMSKASAAIGNIYNFLGLYDKALLQFKKGLELAREGGNQHDVASLTGGIGEAYFKKKIYDSVVVYLEKAKFENQSTPDPNKKQEVRRGSLGLELLYLLEISEYDAALSVVDTLFSIDERRTPVPYELIIRNHMNRGRALLGKEQYRESQKSLEKAYNLAQEKNFTDLSITIFRNLAVTNEKLGNYEASSRFLKEVLAIKDSTSTEDLNQKVAFYSEELQVNLRDKEIAEKQIVIDAQKEEIYRRNTNYYIIISAVLIVGLLLFGFLQYKSKKRKQQTTFELKKKNKEITIAHKALRNALNVKNKFLNTITHELRTPLNVISSSIYLLKNGSNKPQENLQMLEDSSEYLLGYVNNIIEINTFEKNDASVIENNLIDIRALMNVLFGLDLKDLDTNQLSITVDSDIPAIVQGDYTKVSQILINIVDCLLDTMSEGLLQIQVDKSKEEDHLIYLLFQFKLSGGTLNTEAFEKIKQSIGFSYDTVSAGDIRLGIVKKYMQLLPSEIPSPSNEQLSSTLQFQLGFSAVLEGKEKDAPKVNEPLKILLAEDNKIIQKTTQRILAKLGYQCTVVDNGLQAIEAYKKSSFDLILMDIMMPVMDGFIASQKIHLLDENATIIALTAVTVSQNRKQFNEAGIDHVLSKPISADILNEKISSLINGTTP